MEADALERLSFAEIGHENAAVDAPVKYELEMEMEMEMEPLEVRATELRGLSSIALPPVEEGVAEAIAETPVFVTQSGADIAGVIVLRIGTDHLQVENLAVHPAASRSGIATALLQQAERVARQRGLATLRLATHSALARTIGLYRHLGWTTSEMSGPKVMMEKPVSPD